MDGTTRHKGSHLLPPDKFVASLHIHQQLVRLAEVVLGMESDQITFLIYLGNLFYLYKSDFLAMEGKCLVNLPFSHGLHVVHLILAELVRHLLGG